MIRIFITYYNSAKYFVKTYESLKKQTVTDWKAYITDDVSTDDSSSYIEFMAKNDSRFYYILNKVKMWQTGNYFQCVHNPEINDDDICITIDGDDWLSDNEVLKRVLSYYDDKKTLMTFGQFLFYYGENKPFGLGFSKKPNNINDCRKLAWTSSHLRTFKAGLLRKVKKEDLLDHNNHN
jgi:glycosyltransferase involved in cell wall biosynthesis